MPKLNYSTPLHNATGSTSFTATKTCYAIAWTLGTITLTGAGSSTSVVIANTLVLGNTNYSPVPVPMLRLEAGDKIEVAGDGRGSGLVVYEEAS